MTQNNYRINVPIYLRFDKWLKEHSLSWIGESMVWFEFLIPKIMEVAGISSTEVRTAITKVEEGSIILWLEVDILLIQQIFKELQSLYDILTFISAELKHAWIEVNSLHDQINNFAKENPVDYDAIKHLIQSWTLITVLKIFFRKLVQTLPYQKNAPNIQIGETEVPKLIAQRSHQLIKRNIFKKALLPFVDNKIKSIEVSENETFKNPALIKAENFGEYLSEDQKILPDWTNGMHKTIYGKFVSWQRKKWDSLSFRVNWVPRAYRDLICYPSESNKITDFTWFLKEDALTLSVEISRVSLYEKPKLIIHWVNPTLTTLDLK